MYAVATCCYSAQSACNKPRHDKPLSAHPNRQQTYARLISSFVLYCGAARCCLTSRKTYCRLVDKYVHRSFSGPVANVTAGAIKRGLCVDVWLGMSTESDRPCTGGYCIMVLHHGSRYWYFVKYRLYQPVVQTTISVLVWYTKNQSFVLDSRFWFTLSTVDGHGRTAPSY